MPKLRLLAVALSLSLALSAGAVPLELQHQGRLLDGAGLPLDGNHDVAFALYGAPAGGSPLWTEGHALDFDAGFFSAALGSSSALDASIFDGGALYLGIAIDGGAELPTRVAIASVPFAIRAQSAASVDGGAVDASQVSVNGTVVIDASGQIPYSAITGVPVAVDTLASLSCALDEVARYDGSEWTCAPADDHGHDAADIGSGTIDAARLPIGTSAGSVAAGDHAHTAADVGALPATGGAIDGSLSLTGSVQLGDSSAKCDSEGEYGTLRWTGSAFELCSDVGWIGLWRDNDGATSARAGESCKQILEDTPSLKSGTYWIDPTKASPYQVYCDMSTRGGGWTLALKASGAAYEFNNVLWTNTATDNASSLDTSWVNAKFKSYVDLPATELLLKSQGGNDTHLELPGSGTLVSYMNKPTTLLTHKGGSANALHLVNGGTAGTICGRPWRINGYAYDNFPVRLGSMFRYTWDCTSYGKDAAGEACGAESAGFGLRDQRWSPFTYAFKGFGIRQAHDNNSLPGGGQISTGGAIYVR